MPKQNLNQTVLQIVFSFFLGIVVVAFIGIAVNTVFPDPDGYRAIEPDLWDNHYLITGIWLLVCATVVMVASMLIPADRVPVIANGILLGGLFTIIYSVGVSLNAPNNWARLCVFAAALIITVGVAYWKFAVRKVTAAPTVAAEPGFIAGADPFLSARIDKIEHQLDEMRRVLTD